MKNILPIIIATLTFGTTTLLGILLGFPLNCGTLFTPISLFRILQEPLWYFPQVMISLDRLDKFMSSKELVSEDFDEDDNGIVIEVKNGRFCWDDDEEEGVDNSMKFICKSVSMKEFNFKLNK